MALKRDITYLNKDFSSLRDSLITYSKTYFPNTYNDFSQTSPGMMFMEMAAYVGDVMSFYLDNQIQETYLQYARQTNNLYDLAYMLGYKPKVTSVATTTLDFYQILPSVIAGSTTVPDFNYSLEIPTNTVVNSSTNNNVKFLIQDKIDFSYSSSSDPTEITVYQTSGGSPTYYLLKKSRPSISSVIKTTTSTFTTPIPFNFIDINDSNIVGILDITDSDGNKWYEVPYLAQEMVLDSIKNTNINNVAVTALNWNNSAEVNRGTLFTHSTVTNDTRVTFNRKCVVTMVATIVSTGVVTNASMRVRFRVNGSNLLRTSAWLHHVNAGGDIEDACTLVRTYSFAAGDYIEVCTDLQGAAGTITLNGSQSMLEIYEGFQ